MDAPVWELPLVEPFPWATDRTEASDYGPTHQTSSTDAGFWLLPAAGTDGHRIWMSNAQADHLIRQGVSEILNLIPGVGDLKGLIEAVRGTDLLTGDEFAWWERVLSAAGAFGLGGDILRGGAEAGRVGMTIEVISSADLMLDIAAATGMNDVLTNAADTLRSGASIEDVPWTAETTAVLEAGAQSVQRMAANLAQARSMSAESAEQVRELLMKTFILQAQADGLIPRRMEVAPAAAEGGDAAGTVDLRDPMTGAAWEITPVGVVSLPTS